MTLKYEPSSEPLHISAKFPLLQGRDLHTKAAYQKMGHPIADVPDSNAKERTVPAI